MPRASRSDTQAATTITLKKITPIPASAAYFIHLKGRSV